MKRKSIVVISLFLAMILLMGSLSFATETPELTQTPDEAETEVVAEEQGDPTPQTGDDTYTYADFSSATFKMVRDEYGASTIQIKGMKNAEEKYLVIYVSNSATDKPDITSDDYRSNQNVKGKFGVTRSIQGNLEVAAAYLDKATVNAGDIFLWIIEEKNLKDREFVLEAKKIERAPERAVGSRIRIYFFDDETTSFLHSDKIEGMNIKYRIGVIQDKNILKACQNNMQDGLEKLLPYAKSQPALWEGTIPVGKSKELVSSMDLTNRAFYFVYMQTDAGYQVEDVGIYQAIVTDDVKNLTDSNFYWGDYEEQPPLANQDTTVANTKLPATGATVVISVLAVSAIVLAIVSIHKQRKYTDIK